MKSVKYFSKHFVYANEELISDTQMIPTCQGLFISHI